MNSCLSLSQTHPNRLWILSQIIWVHPCSWGFVVWGCPSSLVLEEHFTRTVLVLLVVVASKTNGIGVFWCFSLSGWCWRSFRFKLGFQKRLSTPQNLRKFLRIQIWNKMLAFLSETLNLAASFIVGIQWKSWPQSHCPLYLPFTFSRQSPPGRELDKKPNASYI